MSIAQINPLEPQFPRSYGGESSDERSISDLRDFSCCICINPRHLHWPACGQQRDLLKPADRGMEGILVFYNQILARLFRGENVKHCVGARCA